MKKSMNALFYLFVFATLFLTLACSCVYAANSKEVLNDIVKDMKKIRTETEIKKSDGKTPLDTFDCFYFVNEESNKYFSEDGQVVINKKSYKLKLCYENKKGEVKTINGRIGEKKYDDKTVYYYRTNSILSNNENYYFELIDDSGKAVATTETFKYITDETVTEEVEDSTGIFGKIGAVVTLDLKKLGKILVETFCQLITPVGDAFLDMICASVGEVVTIDGAVYNRVDKVDADFFKSGDEAYYNADGTITKSGVPLRVQMKPVVNTIYGWFKGIAIMVLMVILIYIGIKIMLTSTAEKKASYKTVFIAWVMGVCMLMFFPYVMKYSIQLNNALCIWIGGNNTYTEEVEQYKSSPFIYGTNDFINKILKPKETLSQNAMMYVIYYGANCFNVPLLVVYLILIGQLLAILIIYYKRVFMIAFLIAIFPLVAMIYPLNKIGDIKMNPFGTWFKEFLVNVFVQSFHAATYRVIVTLGVNAYMETQNLLFMIMCILFLFEGEKIIRAIFNVKSSMNSIGDMAMAGAMAMNVMKNAGGLLPDLSKSKGDKDSDEEMDAMKKAKSDRVMASSTPTPGTESNLAEVRRASAETATSGESSGTNGKQFTGTPMDSEENANPSGVQLGRQAKEDTSTPFSNTESLIEETKKNNGYGKTSGKVVKFTGSAFSAVSKTAGATVGMTYGLAQSDTQAAIAGLAAGASTGAKIGKAGKNLMENAVDKVADIQAARVLAGEYESGEHDAEIGVAELAASEKELDREKAQKLRELHARLARRTAGFGSKEGAQLKFIKERLEIEEKK